MYLINSDDERLWLMAIMVQKHTYNVGYNFSDDCSAESLGLWPFCLLYSFNFAMNFDGAPSSNHLYTKKKNLGAIQKGDEKNWITSSTFLRQDKAV